MLKKIEENIKEIKGFIGGLNHSIDMILLEYIDSSDSILSKLSKIEILERRREKMTLILEKSLELRERILNK